MKIKAIKLPIPSSDSYKGLKKTDDWVKLNCGKKITLDVIPEKLKEYVEVIEEKQKKVKE